MKTGLGLDSHRFVEAGATKPLRLGGLTFNDAPGLEGNSDADVLLHAVTDAISGITGVTVIGAVADDMCARGVTDSAEYLRAATQHLDEWRISHVSIVLECARPKIDPKVATLRRSLATLLEVQPGDVCLTATTGEGLSAAGRGEGIHASAVVTAICD